LLPQAVSAAFAHYFEANDLYCGASYTVRFPNWLLSLQAFDRGGVSSLRWA